MLWPTMAANGMNEYMNAHLVLQTILAVFNNNVVSLPNTDHLRLPKQLIFAIVMRYCYYYCVYRYKLRLDTTKHLLRAIQHNVYL